MYGQMCIEKRYVWTDVYRKRYVCTYVYRKEICMDRYVLKRDMY